LSSKAKQTTLLAAVALVVAISDHDTEHRITRLHAVQIGACVALAPLVLIVNSTSLIGVTDLLPAAGLRRPVAFGRAATGADRHRAAASATDRMRWRQADKTRSPALTVGRPMLSVARMPARGHDREDGARAVPRRSFGEIDRTTLVAEDGRFQV